MKLKLFKKYFFTTALVILFTLTVMMMILSFVLNNYFARTKYETLTQCCDKVREILISEESDRVDSAELQTIMYNMASVSSVDLLLTDPDGTVLLCGCEEWKRDGKCLHSAHSVTDSGKKKSDENDFRIGTLSIYEKPHYIASQPIVNAGGETVGTVYSTAPLSAIRQLLTVIAKLYVFSALFPLIFMFFAIYVMTYRLTKPLKLMAEASRAMAKGDFSKRIPVMSDDEIGELSVAFNQMTNSLVQLEEMRKSFVANVSHELKTPMTTIGGFIDGILDGTIESERQKDYLKIVSDEVKRLSRLVQSMLSMAKLESGEFVLKPELFDFQELLCTVVISQEQRIVKQKLNITGLDTVQSVQLKADKDLIYQVVFNLVDNAIKFTEEEGTINFHVKTDGKKMAFTIKNTGAGIPERELPHVFERFYKGDKSRSANKNSTGLGLYIVKTIIKAHGGNISVTAKENEFTAFRILLPIR